MRAPDFWQRDGLIPRALNPLAALYSAAGHLRQILARPLGTGVPVICVGNLVAGGAGKTPVALSLAAELSSSHGLAPHFIASGYRGREVGPLLVDPTRHTARDVGDEALLLSAAAPTWVARDRRAAARAAVDAGAPILVLDDGYQDPAVAKDLSFLVIDGGYGFGNSRVLPAGPLREPVAGGVARADAIVVIGADKTGIAATLPPGRPLLRARLMPAAGAERFAGQRVFAFAGIGRPAKLFETLLELRCELVGTRGFPDHHSYRPEEIMEICEAAAAAAAIPVTTAKDAARLPESARAMVQVLPVILEWESPDALNSLLAGLPLRKASPA